MCQITVVLYKKCGKELQRSEVERCEDETCKTVKEDTAPCSELCEDCTEADSESDEEDYKEKGNASRKGAFAKQHNSSNTHIVPPQVKEKRTFEGDDDEEETPVIDVVSESATYRVEGVKRRKTAERSDKISPVADLPLKATYHTSKSISEAKKTGTEAARSSQDAETPN